MDINKIAELANIMKQNGLTKLDLKEGDSHLILEATKYENIAMQTMQTTQVPQISQEIQAQSMTIPLQEMTQESAKAVEMEDFYEQKTPLVGTVYLAPQSGAAPYVSVGDHICAGETICIVESMKMFNQIAAECSGIIEEVCVDDAQIVEYGQTLFRIRED